jgi:hypothetical protein
MKPKAKEAIPNRWRPRFKLGVDALIFSIPFTQACHDAGVRESYITAMAASLRRKMR